MEWIEQKKREVARLKSTFHFAEALENLARDLLLQHELNHHLHLESEAPLPAILRVISDLEESLDPGQALETLWVLGGMDDPDGLFSSPKARLFARVEKSIRSIRDTEVLYRWAYICFQTGNIGHLATLFLQNRLDEDDFRVILLKARLAIATGQFDLGLEILQSILEDFPEAVQHRAGLFWRAGLIPEARKDYLQLLRENYIPAMKDVARFFLATLEPGRALEAAKLLSGLRRGEPESRVLLGGAYLMAGETLLAVQELTETQNEIWARAFPIKYDSDFRILQDFLRKALFQLGLEAGKGDLLGEVVAHPSFQPSGIPAFLRDHIAKAPENWFLSDIHYLSQRIREPENPAILEAYRDALFRLGDPRFSVFDWQKTLNINDSQALPKDFDRRQEILYKWSGGITEDIQFLHGLPDSMHIKGSDVSNTGAFSPWRLVVQELNLEEDTGDCGWMIHLAARQIPCLKSITFQDITLDLAFAQVWANNPGWKSVKTLHIKGSNCSGAAFRYLMASPEFKPEILSISETSLDYALEAEPTLGVFIRDHIGFHALKSLEISGSSFSGYDWFCLCEANLSALTHLNISMVDLSGADISRLFSAPWINSLDHLNISFTGMEVEILTGLLENEVELQSLVCQMEEDNEELEALKNHPSIGKLGLVTW